MAFMQNPSPDLHLHSQSHLLIVLNTHGLIAELLHEAYSK